MLIYDKRQCALGEGPLWHPERNELFWFDILGKCLVSKTRTWDFEDHVSAAGWVDEHTLIVASETALSRFDLTTGAAEVLVALEADNPTTRSNDGRADPYGGFWIGTMGKEAEPKAGAIYRYYKGELRALFTGITISNAICFSPNGNWAYFSDTVTQQIMRVALDGAGWPNGEPSVYLDFRHEGLNPDGAVVDEHGRLWNAQWGASRVACYGPKGILQSVALSPSQVTCPAFGGADLGTLFVTTAAVGVEETRAGMTFALDIGAKGQAEHRVLL